MTRASLFLLQTSRALSKESLLAVVTGSPRTRSSTPEGTTSKSVQIFERISLLLGEEEARMTLTVDNLPEDS